MTTSYASSSPFIIWFVVELMNKNKIFFAIIAWVLWLLVLFFVLTLRSTNDTSNTSGNETPFRIWIVWDDRNQFVTFLNSFKERYPEYKKTAIEVESFGDYEEYYMTLGASIASGQGPDIFVLDSAERSSAFSSWARWIDPNIMHPNDFRKKFQSVFGNDLILSYTDENQEQKEFLAGIPVWYETLGVFYNRRYVKSDDLSSLSALNSVVSELRERYNNIVPIWIWNGSTVYGVSDIITQFFMLETEVESLLQVTGNKLKQSMASYLLFWDPDGENGYNLRSSRLRAIEKNNLDIFSSWETFMVIWYPRMIDEIDARGFSKTFLAAEPFPHYFSWQWKTLVHYYYFVQSKDSLYPNLSSALLSYLATDSGASEYLEVFPYYLPALLSLEEDKRNEKIHEKYNVSLWDFYNENFELASFDKGIKTLYDREIVPILDNIGNYENVFWKFRTSLLCKTEKVRNLKNLSNQCDRD